MLEGSQKRYVRHAVAALVTAVSLYLVLPGLVAVFASWRTLSELTWYWTAASLLAEGAAFVSLWQLDRIATKVKEWFPVACAQLAGNALGRIVPGGAATSTAFSVSMLRKAGAGARDAVTGLGAATALQTATSLALPLVALPAVAAGTPIPRGLAQSALLGAAVLVALLAGAALAFTTDEPLRFAGRELERLLNATIRRRHKVEGLPETLIAGRDALRATLGRRPWAALAAAAGNTAFDYLALLLVLRAVGAEPRPSLIVLAYASSRLLALLPLTPGGVGFVETGLVGTLTLAGVSPGDSVTATFAYRLVSFWLPIPAGAGAYALFRRRYG